MKFSNFDSKLLVENEFPNFFHYFFHVLWAIWPYKTDIPENFVTIATPYCTGQWSDETRTKLDLFVSMYVLRAYLRLYFVRLTCRNRDPPY